MIADEPLEKNLGGRPPIAPIDMALVKRSAAIGCTINEIASVLGIARSTFYKYMEGDPGIQAAVDEGRDGGCVTLRRLQWQRAEAGSDTMCIWLGKQMLGQKDKSEITGAEDGPVRVLVELVGSAPAQLEAPAQQFYTTTEPLRTTTEPLRSRVNFVGG